MPNTAKKPLSKGKPGAKLLAAEATTGKAPAQRKSTATSTKRALGQPNPADMTQQKNHSPTESTLTLSRYKSETAVRLFADFLQNTTPIMFIQMERHGVSAQLLKDMARELVMPISRFLRMIGVPKATVDAKLKENALIAGVGGQSALGVVYLIGIARRMVASGAGPDPATIDATKWLGIWLERSHPALGGRCPSAFVDTPTGVRLVARLLATGECGPIE